MGLRATVFIVLQASMQARDGWANGQGVSEYRQSPNVKAEGVECILSCSLAAPLPYG